MHSRMVSQKIMSGDMMARVLRSHSPAPPPMPQIIVRNDAPLGYHDSAAATPANKNIGTALEIPRSPYDQSPANLSNAPPSQYKSEEYLSIPPSSVDDESTTTSSATEQVRELGQSVTSADILEFSRRRTEAFQFGRSRSFHEELAFKHNTLGEPVSFMATGFPTPGSSKVESGTKDPAITAQGAGLAWPTSGIAFFQRFRPRRRSSAAVRSLSNEASLSEASRFKHEQIAYLADKERRQTRTNSFPMALLPVQWRNHSNSPQPRHRKSAPAGPQPSEQQEGSSSSANQQTRIRHTARRKNSIEYIMGNLTKRRGSIQIGKIIHHEDMEEHGRRKKIAGQQKIEAYREHRRASRLGAAQIN
ncbi:hypothetical protein DFQ30_005683 [Apophysomyces sp. BC1015]|nr:hypothetical protein DFQ30_005683 [Apophysomyces sp. BC1015]KAG0177621.1 hypothetical protein DFQ29_004630 [Apophysomyces sp. BC1021]